MPEEAFQFSIKRLRIISAGALIVGVLIVGLALMLTGSARNDEQFIGNAAIIASATSILMGILGLIAAAKNGKNSIVNTIIYIVGALSLIANGFFTFIAMVSGGLYLVSLVGMAATGLVILYVALTGKYVLLR